MPGPPSTPFRGPKQHFWTYATPSSAQGGIPKVTSQLFTYSYFPSMSADSVAATKDATFFPGFGCKFGSVVCLCPPGFMFICLLL